MAMIKLTRDVNYYKSSNNCYSRSTFKEADIYVAVSHITAILNNQAERYVLVMTSGGQSFNVMESPEEIAELIAQAG